MNKRINPSILKDVSKKAFVLPEIFLKMINMWPLNQNMCTRIAFYVKLLLIVILELGQLIYFVFNLTNIAKFTALMSTLSTTLQAIVKISIIHFNSKQLKSIIYTAYNEFWPSDFMGKKLKKSLAFTSLMVIGNMYSVLSSACLFAFGFLTKPLIEGSMLLPFESWYPINWQVPFVYEFIYIIQIFTNIYVIIISILGHDYFFLALCSNMIAQYRLLKSVIGKLGSGEDKMLNLILEKFEGTPIGVGNKSEEKKLLIKCIDHHNKLLQVSTQMEYIFSPSLFVQLATSVVAICVSSFLITVMDIDKTQLYHLTSYCLGHVLQLFLICAAGNELAYQSNTLSEYAFNNKWYTKDVDLRKSLILVICRSQREMKLTALGIFNLNYSTFVAVMRLSFSFYTLLSNIIEKKKDAMNNN